MRDNKNINQHNLLKAIPWVTLVILVIVMFYLWSYGQRGVVKSKNNQAETTVSVESSAAVSDNTKRELAQVVSPILNFRSKPNISEKNIITTLSKGTKVKVLEDQGKWLKVQLDDGRIGFITANKKYINFIEK